MDFRSFRRARVACSAVMALGLGALDASASAPTLRLPEATAIELRLETPIDTRRSRSGDPLRFTLSGSTCVDGRRLRAGPALDGRVVHAQSGGVFGKAAELLISAAPWTPEGSTAIVRFRHLRALTGRERGKAATGLAIAAGPFAAFVHGGNVVLPIGTVVEAQTRETIALPAAVFEACTPHPPQPSEPTQGELNEAHDVRPVDPGREPEPEPEPAGDGGRDAHHPDTGDGSPRGDAGA